MRPRAELGDDVRCYVIRILQSVRKLIAAICWITNKQLNCAGAFSGNHRGDGGGGGLERRITLDLC